MRTPLPTRRLVGGVPCALLAVLLVFARLLVPAMAMTPAGNALAEFDRAAREAICHVTPDSDGVPAKEAPAGHAECLVCPVCHLAAAAALAAPAGPDLPGPDQVATSLPAPPPPATGPPLARRFATPPTGPPALSA